MERLFAAIEEQHPGFRVLDIRFSIDPEGGPYEGTPEELDEALAEAVRRAEYIGMPESERWPEAQP